MPKAELPPIDWTSVTRVLLGSLALILATGALAYATRPCKGGAAEVEEEGGEVVEEEGDDDDHRSHPAACAREPFFAWFDQRTSLRYIMLGASAGVVFGAIDNILLWYGISALETVFARLPLGRNSNVVAGYGNAFSSLISAFVSTFVSRFIANTMHVDVDDAPLWSMAFGVVIGCVIGIALPLAISG